MLRNLYLLGIVFLVSTSSLFAQVGAGTLKGKLTDSESGEPLPFVNIVLQSGDQQVAGGPPTLTVTTRSNQFHRESTMYLCLMLGITPSKFKVS